MKSAAPLSPRMVSEMVPEWLAISACILMYAVGFMTCGALIGRAPFWDGVRYVLTFGARRP